MPVYTLYLNTALTNQYASSTKTSNASVTWNINYDDLLQRDNHTYDNCRVRFHLVSTPWNADTTSDWSNYTGYLTATLPSKYHQNRGVNGSILGFIHPQLPPINSIQSTKVAYNINTLSSVGVDINPPKGFQPLTISLYNDDANQNLISWTAQPDWTLLLSFELY
jgi:hypothetical protein